MSGVELAPALVSWLARLFLRTCEAALYRLAAFRRCVHHLEKPRHTPPGNDNCTVYHFSPRSAHHACLMDRASTDECHHRRDGELATLWGHVLGHWLVKLWGLVWGNV